MDSSLKTLAYLWVCVFTRIIHITADQDSEPVQNIRWFSLDFKTMLFWTSKVPKLYRFSVHVSADENAYEECADCGSGMECDVTNCLQLSDRSYFTYILAEPVDADDYADPSEWTHAYAPVINPYRDSNISAVSLWVQRLDETSVSVNLTAPLSSVHAGLRQLRVSDVLKRKLKYKVRYSKARSTGKRDVVCDGSFEIISTLDAGESYCFMAAAYIPSRPTNQMGAWSKQVCIDGRVLEDLTVGAWVGAAFVTLAVVIVSVTVTVLCCRRQRLGGAAQRTQQANAPV